MTKVDIKRVSSRLVRSIGGRGFFWGVVALFVLQASWIAFSFRFPMLYDELFHVEVIKIFSQQISPFIINQPHSYDIYGNLANGGATIFHYMMSFPYRVISTFTDDIALQVITMRLINIAMVAFGLVLYSKLFKEIGIKQIFSNVALLVFIMLPIVPFIAATVNYDNLLFPMSALFFIVCVRILKQKKIQIQSLVWLVVLGSVASLLKFMFLPVFGLSLLYISIYIVVKFKKKAMADIAVSIKNAKKRTLVLLAALTIVVLGLFSYIYVQNIVRYGSINPSCAETLGEKRCSSSALVRRDSSAAATKDQRQRVSLSQFTHDWYGMMVNFAVISGSWSPVDSVMVWGNVSLIKTMVYYGVPLAVGLILYSWRSLKKNQGWYYLATISIGLTITLFLYNYAGYSHTHAMYGVQPRYLLTVAPIMIVLSIVSVNLILHRSRWLKLTVLAVMMLAITQGGGAITHIIVSGSDWNWDNATVRSINNDVRHFLRPFVKEN